VPAISPSSTTTQATARPGLAALLAASRVRKIICSFPRQVDSQVFDGLYRPASSNSSWCRRAPWRNASRQATTESPRSSRRLRSATKLPVGKETRRINGRDYVLEGALTADYALIKAHKGDRLGNLVYRKTARYFAPMMASAARVAVVQVSMVVEVG